MRDLQKDLELCEKLANGDYPNQRIDEFIFGEFLPAAQDGWPEAIQRAMAAEARVKELEAQRSLVKEGLKRLRDVLDAIAALEGR